MPMVSAKHQSRAAENGASLEADVERALTAAGSAVYWHKNHPESLGSKVVGKGPPDFIATWPRISLTVLFDAKSTQSAKWSVGSNDGDRAGKYRGLAPHQRTSLRRMHEAGGVAGVWLRLRSLSMPEDRWIPFRVIDPLWMQWWADRQEQFVTADMGVPIVGGDLLSAIRSAR